MATTTLSYSFNTPELRDVTRALASDWGPTLHQAARRIAAVLVWIYTAYVMANEAWQRVQDWANHHQMQGLARLGLPGAPCLAPADDRAPVLVPAVVVQRLAPALPDAPSIGLMPPTTGAWLHINDPMARAVRLVREGKSQRAAANLCGVSRSSLQRALKG